MTYLAGAVPVAHGTGSRALGGGVIAWMQLYWRPQQLVLLAASLFLVALIYGGIMLAAVLRSELSAMFLLIMTSFSDFGLQNPIADTDAANPVLAVLPVYGAMQSAVSSVGLRLVPSSYLTLGMCWAVGTASPTSTSGVD